MEANTSLPVANNTHNNANKRKHAEIDRETYEFEPVAATPTNLLGIPNAPPYRIVLVPEKTLGDVVSNEDLPYVRKLSQIVWCHYNDKRTPNMWIVEDVTDEAYEISWQLPEETEVSHALHNTLYKVDMLRVTKKSWTTPYQDEKGELWTILSIRVAMRRRRTAVITKTLLFLIETEDAVVITRDEAADDRGSKRPRLDIRK